MESKMQTKEFIENTQIFEKKHKFLLLGGLGFIGKTFFEYILSNDCYEKIVIADKKHLKLSHIHPTKMQLYETKNVKVLQRDLSKEVDVKDIFTQEGPFDIVINFASETRFGMTDEDYKKNTLKVADVCGKIAALNNVEKFIHLSTALVYASSPNTPCNENADLDPVIPKAKMSLAAERAVWKIPNLKLIILRPAIVYGLNDHLGIMTLNLIAASLYKINNETMKIMWDEKKKMNTVHVEDVCRAIMYSIAYGKNGDIFNITDQNDTHQGKFYKLLKSIFKMEITCVGNVKSYLARLYLDGLINDINQKHGKWWFEAIDKYKLERNGPINVNIYKEMLENYDLNIQGTSIKKLGFEYKHPQMTADSIVEIIKGLINDKYMPNVFS